MLHIFTHLHLIYLKDDEEDLKTVRDQQDKVRCLKDINIHHDNIIFVCFRF